MKLVLASYPINLIDKIVSAIGIVPKDCNIVCIPTAANAEDGTKDWLHAELNAFKKAGFNLNFFDLENKSSQDVQDVLLKVDIIYVTGGNTFYLLEQMRACNFEKHLREALSRGAIYIGSSAGSIVCTPDIDYVREIDHPEKVNLKSTTGLGLVDFYLMVHMNQPSFSEPMQKIIEKLKQDNQQVICIEDTQAIYIDSGVVTVISE